MVLLLCPSVKELNTSSTAEFKENIEPIVYMLLCSDGVLKNGVTLLTLSFVSIILKYLFLVVLLV